MKNYYLKQMVFAAMIAAIYATISLVLAPFSFGNIQVRISEALTLLPIIMPVSIVGVTLGCFITNLVGVFMGANILGVLDIFVGTLATYLAAILTYKCRNIKIKGIPVLSISFPIIINALFIGLELAYAIDKSLFWIFAFEVGMGQLIACTILGIPLLKLMEKSNIKFIK